MPYVYSTATNSIVYEERAQMKDPSAIRPIQRQVTIKGGTGLANKHLITPEGVVTHVSDEDADFLEKHEAFNRHRDKGFMILRRDKVRAEKVAAEMNPRDDSRPRTPDDYKDAQSNDPTMLPAKPQETRGRGRPKKAVGAAEDSGEDDSED